MKGGGEHEERRYEQEEEYKPSLLAGAGAELPSSRPPALTQLSAGFLNCAMISTSPCAGRVLLRHLGV